MSAGRLQIFYDGACPLCSREMGHYRVRDKAGRIEWVDIAAPEFHAEAYGLNAKRLQEVMHARTPDGEIYTEVAAFVRIWEVLPAGPFVTPLKWFFKIPGMVWLAGFFYRAFARNRYKFTGRCTAESCALPPPK